MLPSRQLCDWQQEQTPKRIFPFDWNWGAADMMSYFESKIYWHWDVRSWICNGHSYEKHCSSKVTLFLSRRFCCSSEVTLFLSRRFCCSSEVTLFLSRRFCCSSVVVQLVAIWLWLWLWLDRLCGLVVTVPGYRSGGPGSIPSATRFSEK
jgi:hypothetical protein